MSHRLSTERSDWSSRAESQSARLSISQPPKRSELHGKYCLSFFLESTITTHTINRKIKTMSFARAPRGSLFDKEIKNKENLPGPDKYNPKWSNVSLSFVKNSET